MLNGLVTHYQSGFYTVETPSGALTCQLRGRLKKGPRQGDLVALGDRVLVTPVDAASGMIEEVEPRTHLLSRLDPTPRGLYQQIIIANPDQAVFVFACADPAPHLGMLDRFLVICEKQGIPSLIVANKADLVTPEQAQELFGRYPAVGYPVIYTSARLNQGVDALHQRLTGKLSVLAGPSGVGKSSLLNAVQPGLGLAVKDVSQATTKGRHTTVVRQLFPLLGGGYVADTPGLRALALWDIQPEELDGYFPELRDLVAQCQFSDCTHDHEPGCAVLAAVQEGRVHPERFASYQRMRSGAEE
ncbi:MAG: ribosome small subunit-dependent GTPase A [Anaerolineales bacterium]|jgi:ribosome biogenesis GTPase|nr:ribosome small subunit-dependent GTPase A [Anaerolineales bacterium]